MRKSEVSERKREREREIFQISTFQKDCFVDDEYISYSRYILKYIEKREKRVSSSSKDGKGKWYKPKKRRAKGHRQRGYGGNIERYHVSAGVTMAGPIAKTTSRALSVEKRPRPIWRHVKTRRKIRFHVVLPDPKKVRERDLVFTPSQTFSSKVEAEHMVALLALHHFDATSS